MNEPIISAEAKARLTEAVNNYAPPAPEKYRALQEVKDCIVELRNKKASYQTMRAMLKENTGIEISHQTIARYCREMLDSKSARAATKGKSSRPASDKKPATAQKKVSTSPTSGSSFGNGPRIARIEEL